MTDPSQLGPAQRTASLDRLGSQSFDVLVVGGGVTGTGCALDAATRGLSVALVEQRDLASGTSSRSSKLFHGGLRYLEQLDFGLVAEALRERGLMLTTLCPHLARPVSFLYPLQGKVWERPYVGAGVALYDVLASRGSNPLPRHKHLTRRGALKAAPALDKDALVGAVQYWDSQVDDARHTMMLGRTAARHGATVATSVQVTGFLRDGSRVIGATARCAETGRTFDIRARRVINATATWTDSIQELVGQGKIRVRASKGVHLVVPRDRIRSSTGMILRTETSVLFVIPWGLHWIVGTTDTDWDLDLAHPAASRADIDYLLERVNSVLSEPLRHEDIEGVYAGLRPLLEGESDASSELSREHAVSETVPGLITVAGGKYTTYRVMAADAVDVATRDFPRAVPASCTESIPLVGGDGYAAIWNRRLQIVRETGLPLNHVEHLLQRHGSAVTPVLDLIADDPSLGEPLRGSPTYLGAEVVHAASHEGALHLEDVLTRRTRLSIETFHRGADCAEQTATLMGGVLGWDDETIYREIGHYVARVDAERESQKRVDDQTADAARLGAPEPRELADL